MRGGHCFLYLHFIFNCKVVCALTNNMLIIFSGIINPTYSWSCITSLIKNCQLLPGASKVMSEYIVSDWDFSYSYIELTVYTQNAQKSILYHSVIFKYINILFAGHWKKLNQLANEIQFQESNALHRHAQTHSLTHTHI